MSAKIVWVELEGVERRYRFPLPLKTLGTIQISRSAYDGRHEGEIEFCLRLSSEDRYAEDCIDGAVYRTAFPHVVLKQAGHHHVYRHEGSRKALFLVYAAPLRPRLEAFGIDLRSVVWPIAITPRLKDLIGQIEHLLPVARTPGVADELDALAWLLVQHLDAQRGGIPMPEPGLVDGVAAIASHLQTHFDEPLDVDALARRHGLSRRTLFRNWRKVISKTPSAYLEDIRMEHAAVMLRRTPMRVFEIAESIGYESSGYFIGVFKRRFGVSPLAYRRQALADPSAKAST